MLRIVNPATEEIFSELEEDTVKSIQEKFERATQAQREWAKSSYAKRKEPIQKFANLLIQNQERLAKTLSCEMGKPLLQARTEITATPERIHYFLNETENLLNEEDVLDEKGKMREKISHEPLGVIGNISAWNYPYFVGSNVFIPALLTGNAVLYKPSEYTSLTGLAIAELLNEAGIPRNLFIPVIGGGKIGSQLMDQPLAAVYFTGSYVTGSKIAKAAAKRLMKVQLELGGKDPAYACEDADPEEAAKSLADGAFYNTGQSCCAVERIYVHEKIFDLFMRVFLETVRGFVIGDPLDEKTYIGPVARKEQLIVLEEQVKDAQAKGAKVELGGKWVTDRKGYYFAPTVISQVNHQMSVMREESFGPIIGIQKVRDDVEAVSLMNDTLYGLTAAVYSKSQKRAQDILSSVQAGTVYWNCCDRVSPRLPWSGRKHSGIGSTLSREGIRAFLQPKAWHLRFI